MSEATRLSIRSRFDRWNAGPDRQRSMLLLEVARQYYDYGMSQASIAEASGYSRPTVGRMLAEARESGIVHIQVTHPLERVLELEATIRNRFGIDHVHVAPPNLAQRDGVTEVARATSDLLDAILGPNMSVGLSNGRILTELLNWLRPHRELEASVVQLVGGVGDPIRLIDTPELCRQLAQRWGGVASALSGPLIAQSAQVARDLRALPDVARTLALGARVDLAIIGVGAGFRHPASVFHGVLTPAAVRTLHRRGAVGHILGRFVDPMGKPIATGLDDRVVALDLDQLRSIPLVLAVAAGAQKAPALAAALRGGYLGALVIDVSAAQALAHLPERRSHQAADWRLRASAIDSRAATPASRERAGEDVAVVTEGT